MFKLLLAGLVLFSSSAIADNHWFVACNKHRCFYHNFYPSNHGWRKVNGSWTHSCLKAPWLSDRDACSPNN